MHQLQDEEQPIRFHRGEIFTICDYNFCDPDFSNSAQGLVQKGISFFAAFLWLKKIRLVKKLWIDLLKVYEIGDIDGVGGFDPHLFEVFVTQNDVAAFFVFESFYDLISRNFLQVGFGDFFVFDRAQVGLAQLPKTELFFTGSRVNRNRNVNQAEADAAFPGWAHNSDLKSSSLKMM